MFTFDSKHTRSRYKIHAQQQQETFGVVNRRQFGANYIPMISFHSQAPHVQGHLEIWKQVFTVLEGDGQNIVSYAAVLCLVTQRSSSRSWVGALRDETKNGCVGD